MRRFILFISFLAFSLLPAFSQFGFEPVSWKFSLKDKGNGEVEVIASATIDPGWHLYDVKIPPKGPTPTQIKFNTISGAELVGEFTPVDSKLKSEYDPNFKMEIGYYADKAKFVQLLKVTDKESFALEGHVRAQACNDETCTPPIPVDFSFAAKDLPATVVAVKPTMTTEATSAVDSETEKKTLETSASVDTQTDIVKEEGLVNSLWTPVTHLKPFHGEEVKGSLFWLFIVGMGGGLLALMTPCVWPLIPMTVSFFLKRNKKDKKKAIKDAVTYGLGIIVIYVSLGLIITAIFGASALNDLSTNAYFNLFFAGLLIFFAISFFGAFEIVLPSSWSNKIDSKAESTTGILSIFLMAFTLALVSFSCTGPVIGTVLVQTANSGAILGPAIVMFGFAFALAVPFSLFAIFPSWLENLPKSGGWLNSVKVVLAFIELALALKFLSVADLAYEWRLLDREVFLVLWIVIFTLLGLYLLGKIRFPHDDKVEHTTVPRLFLAIIPLAFALYMVPGLWGAPLKNISAFAPPLWTQDFNLYDGAVHANFDDYETGMAYAKRVNKPVFVDFSGFGCVNCRKMENAVWSNPQVKAALENDFVLITLMVDAKKDLPEALKINENGRQRSLTTIGDKWSYLQRYKFQSNSQPYYVMLDHDGNALGDYYFNYKEDVDLYMQFINMGLRIFKEKNSK